ncbi:hypothetical protein K435DRAFT_858789 [Dendrothele bispora CBS 962.96]|uniref:Uncharacterized protein n=1 Tax=Dendrothele bispora (strain CBS 962.96) TaxID=1314807 RepID=A0A4S8M3B8_DENBC|nr:hypothetical protein K435DRAFT_858789 [Dendrothele bispora CBS 962.96]
MPGLMLGAVLGIMLGACFVLPSTTPAGSAIAPAAGVVAVTIRRIPNEILAEIFVASLPYSSVYHCPTSVDKTPLKFMSVCKNWKRVALSTPELWCRAYVCISGLELTEVEFLEGQTRGIDMWLQRSGGLPLSLSIDVDYQNWDTDPRCSDLLAQFLERWCSRWRALDLTLKSHTLMELMKAVPREDMSKLEALSIRKGAFFGEDPQFNDSLNHFLALGSLRALHLYDYDTFDHRASALGFRWEQLTELTLAPISRGEGPTLTLLTALDILSCAKSLRSCTMKLTSGEDAIVQNRTQPAITLPFLHTLDLYLFVINQGGVSYANQDDAVQVFNRLITPSLKILTIGSPITGIPFSAHIPFLCLLSQPSVKIETLNIACTLNTRSH